jgi:hypothetical protein
MKVCVVGASGKLGQYLIQHALERGHEVVGVCREQSVPKLDAFRDRITIVPVPTDDPRPSRKRWVWLLAVVLPLWTADQIDPATLGVVSTFPWVLIVVVVIPWGYVFRQYVTNRGDRWRSTQSRPIDEYGAARSRGAQPEVDAGL